MLFRIAEQPEFILHVEICEDLWVPTPPSSFATLAGATVVANLSASNIVIGKEGYRHQLVSNQSARCLAAYLYSAAGFGESTTDLAWDGHAVIYENGTLVAESRRFADAPQLAVRRHRPRAPHRRPHAAEHLRRGGAAPPRRRRALPHARVFAAAAGGEAAARTARRSAALRAERPENPRRALRGSVPHPGERPGDAACAPRAARSS